MKKATKRLLAFVLAAAMILSLVPAAARAEENENLALGKNVTVSSYEDGTNFDGSKIVDGNRDTASRWGTGQDAGAGEWAEIDLGGTEAIKQIDIYFERPDAEQNILAYQVEFYANGAYTTVYTKSEKALQHENIVLDEALQAEKVKITILNADGGALKPLFDHLLDSRNGIHYEVANFNTYHGGIGGADHAVLVEVADGGDLYVVHM